MNLSDEQRRLVGKALTYLFLTVVLLAALALLLWIGGWWPERLIPFVPVDRL